MKHLVTVTGEAAPEACRMALSHEHFFIDLRGQAAPGAQKRPLTAADRPRLLCDPYCLTDNLVLDDGETALEEAEALLQCGCDTVVECSTPDIGRDPAGLRRLAEKSGLKIVMGCGHYTADTHPAGFDALSEEAVAEALIAEIEQGVQGVRPGIIGEIGTSREILPAEAKALRAAAAAHRASGLAVQVHIYPWSENGTEAAEMLISSGVDPRKIVICHSDAEPCWTYITELLRMGVFVELDNFGKEFTPEAGGFAGGRFIPDRERAALAAKIIDAGYGSQLLLTNDICLKCMLKRYGGDGYVRIFREIVPMIAAHGIPEAYLRETILRENPLRMLAG